MKKVLLSAVLLSLLLVPVIALGQDEPVGPSKGLVICCGPESVVQQIVNWLFGILLVVAALFLILAGYFFVTAQGDPDKVSKARTFVLYAMIGVMIGILAFALVQFVGLIVGSPVQIQ